MKFLKTAFQVFFLTTLDFILVISVDRCYADKKKITEQETLSTTIDQELLNSLEKEGELRVACIHMEHEAKMANIRCRQVDNEIQE